MLTFRCNLTPWSGLARRCRLSSVPQPQGAWGTLFRRSAKDGAKGQGADELVLGTKAGYYLPNINLLQRAVAIGNHVPARRECADHEKRTRTIYISLRTSSRATGPTRTPIAASIHLQQDDSISTVQRPEMLPYKLSDEMPVRSDALQVAYRRRRNELIDKGWGIDMHQIVGDGPRDVAVVIPSPARTQ